MVHERYRELGSLALVAERYEVSKHAISDYLRAAGLPVERRNKFRRRDIDPEWLRRMYVDEKKPPREIAALAHAGMATIQRHLDALGIRRR